MIIQSYPTYPHLDGHMFDRRQNRPGSGFAGLGAHVFDQRQNNMHLRGLADAAAAATPAALPPIKVTVNGDLPDFYYSPLFRVAQAVSIGVSAYHGYKRNHDSIGWGIGWGLLGGLFPVITPTVAVCQGLGKRK